MKTEKSMWVKISETLVRARAGDQGTGRPTIELPALDQELNDEVLGRTRDEDPLLRTALSYCQTHIENNLRQAFNAALTERQQLEFLHRAGGVAALVEDVEGNRQRLRQELLDRQKQESRNNKGAARTE